MFLHQPCTGAAARNGMETAQLKTMRVPQQIIDQFGWNIQYDKETRMTTKPFKGVINIDIQDSKPDWTPYAQPLPPEGAPSVLYILVWRW